ncbi:MAG: CocE/NonD family hydrolase, partial [Pseudomonadota bacterium]
MKSSTSDTHWITLPDGTRLAATLWMPDGDGPFPAVLEYLPYRRRDGTAVRDDATYPGFAAAGIAGVRVDSRGQGDSEGTFDDEYSQTELQDCCDVIAWIASQQWSNGAVGMMGISWGGFNGLQVAALRPPALKAVISIASTSDRYGDDIHYKGGSLLSANVSWATTMLSYTSRPPDPMVVGNRWADIWRDRLENMPFLLETWLQHPHRDAYWRHGSICEDWDAIECPVWVIAGWADGYRNTPAAIARHLGAPVKAMTGPWVHKYPHFAWPRPRADFIGMATRWWRQWLCDEDHAVEGWADHMIYKIEAARPADWRSDDPGCWVGQPRRATVETLKLTLGSDGILPGDLREPVTIETPQHCGTRAGEYFTLAPDADMPGDQGPDDALSACWQTAASADPIDISGRPTLDLRVAVDRAQGNLIARLCDVHPDGTSTLISRGVLNLCHRTGHETPAPVTPGEEMDVSIALDETAYRVRPGHCLRLAISTAYWPLVVPSP